MTTLAQFARDESFAECRKHVEYAVYAFFKRHGGDIDELMSAGLVGYVQAAGGYDPSRGARFDTWVRTKVWAALMQHRRKEGEHRERWQQGDDKFDWEKVPQGGSRFKIEEFLSNLAGDALTLAKLVLDSPPEMAQVVTDGDLWGDVLRGMGWSVTQINQACVEIRKALF
jgi:hypothetical protein